MLPAELVGGGNKHLQRRIARPRPIPPGWRQCDRTPLPPRRSSSPPRGSDYDGHASRWRSPASAPPSGRGSGRECRSCSSPRRNPPHRYRSRHRFHLQRLLRQRLRGDHMAHHQKTDGVHPQLAGKGNMLRGDVRFAAVGGDPHHPRPA